MICGTHNEIYALKLCFSRNTVHAVNVTVIAGFDIVFMQHVHNLAANKITPNGREMEEEQNRFFAFAA